LDSRGQLLVRPRPSSAVRWFRKSALAGNADGQNNLGVRLSRGYCVPRDEVEALHWFKCAFSQGYLLAAANIASVYKDWGNNRRAMFWYQRAAHRGDGEAWVEVGRGYYKGAGVRADPNRAVRYFRKAIASRNISQAGRENAMFHLGVAFYEGRGAIKSNALALKWLAKANTDDDHVEARKLIEKVSRELTP
jgi:TPR repeat protein